MIVAEGILLTTEILSLVLRAQEAFSVGDEAGALAYLAKVRVRVTQADDAWIAAGFGPAVD